jgi:hypothetical protein
VFQVDFSKDSGGLGRVQMDAFYDNSHNNRASDRWQEDEEAAKKSLASDMTGAFDAAAPAKVDTHFLNKEEYFKQPKFPEMNVGMHDPNIIPVEIAFDSAQSAGKKPPRQEALAQAIDPSHHTPRPFVIAMYVVLGVLLVVMVGGVTFAYRHYRRKHQAAKGTSQHGSVSNAKDWVGRATLERNHAAHSAPTSITHPLLPQQDFNGNVAHPQASLPPPLLCSSNPSSAPNSNRNSTVSTYEGSECSIRITSNPLRDSCADGGFTEAEWDYERLGLTYDQLMDYFENLRESSA